MTHERDDMMLDDLFAKARTVPVSASDALLARIAADAADAVMPVAPLRAEPRRGVVAAMIAALGGWTAVSGLAAATVAGIWIGISPPQAIDNMTGNLLGSGNVSVPFLELGDPFGVEG